MTFFASTVLEPQSPLFRGRSAELDFLLQRCQDAVVAYLVIYGGRQNGKTSLLLRLEDRLADPIRACRVDFQLIKGASAERAFALLAAQVAQVFPAMPRVPPVSDGPSLLAFLEQALARPDIPRLVLLLDELGALPAPTREVLAHALRSFFQARFRHPALAKLQIVFSGGIELYDLVVTEASSLHSICEELYLADLPEAEAVALIADGLRSLGGDAARAAWCGHAVFAWVSGHPYLTQRIGSLLETAVRGGAALAPAQIDYAVRQIQRGDPLLRRIRDDLREHRLEEAARRLLTSPPRFTRLDEDMARLELIGLAKDDGARWAPRNALLAGVFRELLGLPPAPAPALPALPRPSTPAPPTPVPAPPARGWFAFAAVGVFVVLAMALIATLQSGWGSGSASVLTPPAGATASLPPATPVPAPPVAPTATTPPAEPTAMPTVVPTATTPPAEPTAMPTPLPAWVPELIRVPAGPFLMGSSDADTLANDNEKPQHDRELSEFWIGKTEVTNAQFRPFVAGDGYTNREYWTAAGWAWKEAEKITQPGYWDDPQWNGDAQPVVGVSWFEAVAYCRWLSAQTGLAFRLPTEAEWEKAARGPEGLIWPWGNIWEAGRANTEAAGVGRTTPVGQYPEGASPYGALDMAGNVWEWCATQWGKQYPYQVEDEWTEAYLEADAARRFRGGAWDNEQKLVRGAYRNARSNPRYRYFVSIGLRVASHSLRPDPGF